MDPYRGRPMDYLGALPCEGCAKLVRVYNEVPERVLCSRCRRRKDSEVGHG